MIERVLHLASSDESGQTMAEYAVVLGVITIAVVVTLGLLVVGDLEPAQQRHQLAVGAFGPRLTGLSCGSYRRRAGDAGWRTASRRHQAAMIPATPGR